MVKEKGLRKRFVDMHRKRKNVYCKTELREDDLRTLKNITGEEASMAIQVAVRHYLSCGGVEGEGDS